MAIVKESSTLIAGRKIAGVALFDIKGENIGTIYDVVIDMRSGQVVYAIASLGGVLGIGKRLYPLPWPALAYGSALGGYEIKVSTSELARAPSFAPESLAEFLASDRLAELNRYYRVEPGWMELRALHERG